MRGYRLPDAWQNAIEAWVSYLVLLGHSPATRKVRRDHVRSVVRRCGVDSPAQLSGPALAGLCGNPDWSAEHRKAVRASLVSFYAYCVKAGIVDDNPTDWLPRVKSPLPAPRPATDDMWARLMQASPREQLMARLAGEAGLRRAEVAGLHRDDLIADRGGWSLRIRGKGGKQRVVPVTDGLAADVQQFREAGFLFPGQSGGHLHPQYVGQLISALMPDGWSIHRLRSRYATRGYAGTGNLRAVQEALGHSSVATTQRYVAVSASDIRSVSEAASAAVLAR